MTQTVNDYARMLRSLQVHAESIDQAGDIFETLPQVMDTFADPSVELDKKHNIIDEVFPKDIRDFLKILCDNEDCGLFKEIAEAYRSQNIKKSGMTEAVLTYVVKPTDEQLARFKKFALDKGNSRKISLTLKEDASLIGGFILKVGNQEYDWSTKGRLEKIKQSVTGKGSQNGSAEEIISIIRSEIDRTEFEKNDREIGVVTWISDGIVNVEGIDHAMYGEIVIFDNGVKGMVQDIRTDDIGCILFGRECELAEGTRVIRTGKRAGIPVGHAFLGRVINALGEPLDNMGAIEEEEYRPIENSAPSIVDRKSVSVPMETGILSIDSMFPIGRGQRELIIGDRQTGKTSIAVDTILNQKGKGVICIYVAIGQKASTVAKIVDNLKKHGAMDYSIVVAATASDSASLQYIVPYSGTAMAEFFMYQGKDVLIVYDDLSKHAVAYRALSLLLERSPGREAYPGDVFYLHSRLLERSSRLTPELGGGSITALPVIETQAGDISAYIPTNVISITDGQIFLESDLFFSGMRPAVNVGFSVSRVGGAAQTKAMKTAAGSIRIDLAQYREMQVFTQFSSDLDDATRQQLNYGAGLMELLKQPLYRPLSMAEQVVSLVAATNKKMVDIKISQVKKFQMDLLAYMAEEHGEIMAELSDKKVLTSELKAAILKATDEFKAKRQAE